MQGQQLRAPGLSSSGLGHRQATQQQHVPRQQQQQRIARHVGALVQQQRSDLARRHVARSTNNSSTATEQAAAPSNGSSSDVLGTYNEADELPCEERPPGSPCTPSFQNMQVYGLEPENWDASALSIVVVGASGDLAKKKILPALFALYYEGMLPEYFNVFGFSRTDLSHEEFRETIVGSLTCRINSWEDEGPEACNDKMDKFLERCFYVSGQYGEAASYDKLDAALKKAESGRQKADRLFYLSIPPSIFTSVAANVAQHSSSKSGWSRVIVEKPFGRDSESFRQLSDELYQHLTEEQIYRIDHYLGKELIENLTVLRFANLVFEPLWSRQFIRNVQVIFSEDFGTQGRGGYFDQYGIVRDVVQNHLLQILSLFAMEPPVSLDAEDIRNEKVKVLRSMRRVTLDDVVLGQYRSRTINGVEQPGYLDDDTVPNGSLTPTFAAVAMHINNARWDGVPFLLKAGKALAGRMAEIRVQFRHVPGNLYRNKLGVDLDRATNELVIRIQPNESIYLKVNNKVPGLGLRLDVSRLDLTYKSRFKEQLPDAYERLILDVINGDKRLFIRNDELEAAWELFTPVLDEIEQQRVAPELYPYGSRGPIGAHYLAAKHGVRWGDLAADDAE